MIYFEEWIWTIVKNSDYHKINDKLDKGIQLLFINTISYSLQYSHNA